MENEQRWVYSVEIDRMTVGVFRFRLTRDWERIIEGISTLGPNNINDAGPYHDGLMLFWSDRSPNQFFNVSTIEWEHLLSDKIVVEFDGDHALSAQIMTWLNDRFGIDVKEIKKTDEDIIQKGARPQRAYCCGISAVA